MKMKWPKSAENVENRGRLVFRVAFTPQPMPLDAPNPAGRPDLGGLQALLSLETAPVFGTGSGSPAVGQLTQLSLTATVRPGGRIAELAVRQPSHTSSKRQGFSDSCAVTES